MGKEDLNSKVDKGLLIPADNLEARYEYEAGHELLPRPEEILLIRKIDEGRTFKGNGERTLENMVLTDESREAYEKLVSKNYRLVVKEATKHTNRGVEFLDLVQFGNIGLLKAAAKIDPNYDNKFCTYAVWWIRQAIFRGISDEGRTIRVPVHQLDTKRMIDKTKTMLFQKLNRDPTITEIAEYLELSEKKIRACLSNNNICMQSLDESINSDDDESELENFVEDKTVNIQNQVEENISNENIRELLECLNDKPRLKLILELRYGLVNGKFYTLDELGTKFKITRERIRQLEVTALKIVRDNSRSKKILFT
ncbi:MAG: sigma-70 family RNA polymerase sigma factor [Candidatus Shapirobacteria bacterium]|jgi:RNA polymerase primary sigma factor